MREVAGFFDGLFFSECVLGHARTEGRTLIVPVHGLFVLGKHPLAKEKPGPYEGELVFEGTAAARRTVIRYIGDPRNPEGFEPKSEEVEVLPEADVGEGGFQEFALEGYQETPSAWIEDWRVRARFFKLRIK